MAIGVYIRTEEHKRNLSLSMIGKNHWMKGRKLSKETIEKMKMSHLGYKHSEDTKKKMSMSALGKHKSEEHKKKLSKALNGNKNALGKHWKMSEETKRKIGEYHRGSKSHFWRGGICKENVRIRQSLEYKIWRKKIFERDNYTCVLCGARNKKGKRVILHPDHIKKFSDYPKLRFDINNGRTLCVDCHRKTDTYGIKLENKKLKEVK